MPGRDWQAMLPSQGPPRHVVRQVDRALAKRYGEKRWDGRGDPLGGLIATILSQSTTYRNSGPAYESLRARFATWEQAEEAPVGEIADAIRRGGLANQKAARIKELLGRIRRERGELSLDFLADLPPQEAARALMSFKGVGPKTAACVLLFDLGRPVFPVDTHVLRITRRLGWIPATAGAESAQVILEPLIPPELRYSLHVNLIAHGRALCRPQKPRCGECPVARWCQGVGGSDKSRTC